VLHSVLLVLVRCKIVCVFCIELYVFSGVFARLAKKLDVAIEEEETSI